MNPEETIRALLASAGQVAGEQEQREARIAARVAWARQTIDAMFEAQKRVQEAWDRIFDELPDDLSEEELEKIPEPPEQAVVDALYEQIAAVRDHDRWPKHLHWTL